MNLSQYLYESSSNIFSEFCIIKSLFYILLYKRIKVKDLCMHISLYQNMKGSIYIDPSYFSFYFCNFHWFLI